MGGGCANMGEPPGGPPDSTPPRVVITLPESGAVLNSFSGDATIHFDEVIDEMAGGASGAGGIAGIGRQIVLSPVAGDVKVSWHRSSIHVKPAEGWKPGRVYHLQILPGIPDLRHNVMKQGKTIVFSTGPALPHAAISGIVLQWVEQHALAKAVIRAAPLPDTVAYVTIADSNGAFSLSDLPPGAYKVTAIQDQNANRRLDPREAFDTATVRVDTTATATLWVFPHDTTPVRLREVDPVDTTAVRLTFSEPLDPAHPLDTTHVHLFALPETTAVALDGVWTATQYDSVQARARAVADSLKRLSDTTHHNRAPSDTGAHAPEEGPPGRGRGEHPPGATPGAPAAPADTGKVKELLRQRPIPIDRFVAHAAKPLTPSGHYLVRVRGATNLTGRTTTDAGQQVFEAAKRAPPPAHPDSSKIKPAKPR